jgi:4-amino-4-deoxy-L-arabinose transferase-like glycosyltransferase
VSERAQGEPQLLPAARAQALGSALAAWLPLGLALLVGLALRLALWGNLPRTGAIGDEGEYLAAATWLAQGRGFAWYLGYLWTRAPLYPLFVALHLRLFGSVEAVYLSQSALSLLNVALVFWLARRMGLAPAGAGLAALLMALYLPFATYAQLLLSETLFISLLLAALLALLAGPGRPAPLGYLAVAGVLLGLGALTRSLALGFVPLAALWILWVSWRRMPALAFVARLRQALAPALLFCALVGATILPWTIYNSRAFGGLIVIDTTGAFNLLLGAQTAYDGQRTDAATRDKVLALLADLSPEERARRLAASDSCMLRQDAPPALGLPTLSQADRQRLMLAEAACLIRARPLAFASKAGVELIDLFQINYGGDERLSDGFAGGELPPWYALTLFVLDDTLYVLVLPLAVLGFALARGAPGRGLIGLWWAYNLATAPLLFAINRFRLPLLPFAFIFAVFALVALARWARRQRRLDHPHAPLSGRRWPAAALALLLGLVAATPYAYLEPIGAGGDSRWASYLGPYPSSLASTRLALARRERHLRGERLRAALRVGDAAEAQELLDAGNLPPRAAEAARVLLPALAGDYQRALALLPPAETIGAGKDVQASVLRGDLLRSLGQERPAKDAFTPEFVDSANPVQWSWDWLHPTATARIDFGGNLDLGYVEGCYLGEGDPAGGGTFRWCADGMQMRFPRAGTGGPQVLVLRADGRGWPRDMLPLPPVQVFVGGVEAGSFTPDPKAVREFSIALPPSAAASDLTLSLRSASFVPDASDYLAQQGRLAGQVRRLAVRLDWAELRDAP